MHMGLGSLADELARSSVIDRPALDRATTTAALDKSTQAALTSASKQDPGAAAAVVQQQTSGYMAVKAANAPICRQMVESNAALMAAIQQSGQSVESMIELCSRDINQFRAQTAALGLEKQSRTKYLWIGGGLIAAGVALHLLTRKKR